jgi:chromosome condensin MukBEF MukE localization factor
MSTRVFWDYVVLQALSDEESMDLKDIYALIDKDLKDGSINPQLFNVDLRWGDRPKYTHVVRSTMSSLRKRGMVEHVGTGRTGRYRITAAGRQRLEKTAP